MKYIYSPQVEGTAPGGRAVSSRSEASVPGTVLGSQWVMTLLCMFHVYIKEPPSLPFLQRSSKTWLQTHF